MTVLQSLTEKLLQKPTDLQFMVTADCLRENGYGDFASACHLGFQPDICEVWFGNKIPPSRLRVAAEVYSCGHGNAYGGVLADIRWGHGGDFAVANFAFNSCQENP